MAKISDASVKVLSGVGPARVKAYAKLGINTVSDLIYHFPRAYENRGDIKLLSECVPGNKAALEMVIGTAPKKAMIRRGMTLLKFTAFDESGTCEITFYNQNYLADKFPLGATFRFYGQVEKVGKRYKMNTPAYEMAIEGEELKPLVPVYPLTEGISKNRIAADIESAMSIIAPELDDYLPDEIRRKYKLCTLPFALRSIHDPTDYESVARAKRRLVFDEFFTFALGMTLSGQKRREYGAPICDNNDLSELLASFPYELTGDQMKAIGDIKRDMAKDTPMSRILVGDVGCGKTICAMAAMYIAVKSGRQAVLMAPTEILARQHYSDIAPLFEKLGFKTELLVGSLTAAQKKRVRASLIEEDASLRTDVVIGTHALISEGVEFHSAGVLVTDEQHRFGVGQRATLSKKGECAHVLVMSATPIPRTLALTIFGDMEISEIKSKPAGRKDIITKQYQIKDIKEVLHKCLEQIQKGNQVYVVAPLIEGESESYSVNLLYDKFNEAFNNKIKIEALHGKKSSTEKQSIIENFKNNTTKILISTTVIEVGIDVKNATTIIIFNAERFGLATLHQLRGRVGRNDLQSYCYLISDSDTERLKILEASNDGFYISEKDFELRGIGDIFGTNQSGEQIFKMANLKTDYKILEAAKKDSKEFIEENINNNFQNFKEYQSIGQNLIFID